MLVEDVGELYPDHAYRSVCRVTRSNQGKPPQSCLHLTCARPLMLNGFAGRSKHIRASGKSGKDAGKSFAVSKTIEPTRSLDEPVIEKGEVGEGGASTDAAKEASDKDAVGKTDSKDASGKKQEGDAEAVDEAELAAHHMPDLIEGVQPMFKSPEAAGGEGGKGEGAAKPSEGSTEAGVEAQSADSAEGKVAAGAAVSTVRSSAAAKPSLSGTPKGKEDGDDTVYYDCFDLKIVYERNRCTPPPSSLLRRPPKCVPFHVFGSIFRCLRCARLCRLGRRAQVLQS